MDESSQIAVVGAGVAGLTAAWLLRRKYDVHVYDRNAYLGGHTHTFVVPDGVDAGTPVDMGFIVMNKRNYPVLTRIFDVLDVERGDSNMSFSYHNEADGNVYAGHNLNTMFARRRNLLRPSHVGMLRDILRFSRTAAADLEEGRLENETLGDYLTRGGFGEAFADRYLLAMGSAIWSAPHADIARFPAKPFIQFFSNHGLLSLSDRPQWQYVIGGSHTYVKKMQASLDHGVFVSRGVRQVTRSAHRVTLAFEDGGTRDYDKVVVGTHADEALKLLGDPTPLERELLGPWRYQENHVVLHTDASIMPPVRSAWASWNFAHEAESHPGQPVSVSYHMNRLQCLLTRAEYIVTLNRTTPIPEDRVLEDAVFTHPLYSFDSMRTQARLPELNREGTTVFCGSYFGYGFHEDAARSGVQAAERWGVRL